MLTIEIANKLL